ncbi:MAG: thiamine-phosphate kinase [Candidatus Euphemobacter frigidus]|nr:thiamine-phosphate kinase [Candidatus Euphemobacter frigidus]MDP8275774.1 thiamine-phosphate kinase [Candidatus Euphemobacter frigidus]
MKIKERGEFGLIEDLSRLIPEGEGVIKGIGDDAAVLPGRKKGWYLLIATDSIVEKIHFRRSAGARRIGRKALAVNLSDIAAMGGLPLWAVVNLGLPPGLSVRYCRQLYRGMGELADEFDLSIVGGDTFRSPSEIMISVTVVGEVEKERCIFRSGAKPGQVLCVTGELGSGRGKHLDFIPRIREARFLVKYHSPSAMIDLSDGLFADLDKLCRASGVGAVIGESALPLGAPGRKGRRSLKEAGRGEEFELLFSLPEKELRDLIDGMREALGTRVTPIGRILENKDRFELVDPAGQTNPIPIAGYDHFKQELC